MTTSWSLYLTRHETGQDGESTIAQLITGEPTVMAATMRAVADQLDPPKPVRPAYRSAADRREAADQRFREKLAGYGDADPDGARCRGNACDEGHTYAAGCLLAPVTTAPVRRMSDLPLRDADGPNYAHDADCNTIHDAGPEPCPPSRIATPAEIDAMVCPDCFGDRHTYELGKCALKPPWNGVVIGSDGRVVVADGPTRCRGGACDEGHTYGYGCLLATRPQDVPVSVHLRADGTPFVVRTMSDLPPRECGGDGCNGCEACWDPAPGPADQGAPVVIDDPGARMDAPDAVLSASAAEVVARMKADQARRRINPKL